MAATQEEPLLESSIVWETPSTPITPQDYVFHSGRRFVRPYFFEFIAHAKERWDRKTIVDVFADEFRQRPRQYYVQAVGSGRILVNGKVVTSEYVVRASQTLSHFVHRHEPPVMADSVELLDVGTDVITVCKPASVPVHPCGQYRKNTVLGILQAEHEFGDLYPIHRLDRLVSGLLILARNAHTANRFCQEIESTTVKKVYVAKVQGVFPREEIEVNAAVIYDFKEGRSTIKGPIFELQKESLSNTFSKKGSALSKGEGKHACTTFRRLHTDGVHSIVECIPLTGRTHQIRVHLQYVGHPIANDALYLVTSPPKRTEMGTSAERAARIGDTTPSICASPDILTNDSSSMITNSKRRKSTHSSSANEASIDKQGIITGTRSDDMPESPSAVGGGVEFVVDPMCTRCPHLSPAGYEDEECGLWLHCKSYSGQGWKYECPLPSWAAMPS